MRFSLLALALLSMTAMADQNTKGDGEGGDPNQVASPYAGAVFQLAEATLGAMREIYDQIDSSSASLVPDHTQKLLTSKAVFKALMENAKIRFEADKKAEEDPLEEDPAKYARMAMAGLQTSIRQSPGVMTKPEVINRAKLIAEVADYYAKNNPAMCRFLPNDFTILLSVDSPWVAHVNPEILEQAIEDEYNATVRLYSGAYPVVVTDVDAQMLYAKFATEWLEGLPEDDLNQIAEARRQGNYCLLWSAMLKDGVQMSRAFPTAVNKVILPLMTMPSRGWLDVGKWFSQPAINSQQPAAE